MQNEEFQNVKEKISHRIYTTKKIRMNLEERLIETNKFWQILIVYYSLIIVGFSILALIKSSDQINYAIVLSSIAITIFSVYLSSENYVQRANDIKNNYTKIAELEIKLELLVDDKLTEINLNSINYDYQELLRQVENHREIDYQLTKDKKPNIFYWEIFKLWLYKKILFILPLIVLLMYSSQIYLQFE